MKLVTCSQSGDVAMATYTIPGTSIGAEVPDLTIHLTSASDKATASVDLGETSASDEEAAFDVLAERLEAAAQALRNRGAAQRGIPLYS